MKLNAGKLNAVKLNSKRAEIAEEVAVAPTFTGGWYEREETEEEKRLERERLGIIEPEKQKKKPVKVAYIGETERIERITDAKEIDKEIQRLILRREEAEASEADIDALLRIYLALSVAQERARQIEEQDIVFVMTMLAV
jgi:hypothetical protein